MQKVPNFGFFMAKSNSLKKMLEYMGVEVHFIDIEKKVEDDKVVGERIQFR